MKRYIILLLSAIAPFTFFAQSGNDDLKKSFEEFRASLKSDFDTSRGKILDDYQSFRSQVMKEYVDFVRKAWSAFDSNAAEPLPDEQPVPPVTIPDEEKTAPIDDKPLDITVVVEPKDVAPQPQPQPFVPIEPVPVKVERTVKFRFFGTPAVVRFNVADKVTLRTLDNGAIADAIEKMAAGTHDNLIVDCLELRETLCLSDWAYIKMLEALSKHIYGNDANSATLLMAYLYMSSGYKMRLAMDGKRLYMLYASLHYVYEQPYYEVDGVRYYCLENLPLRLEICEAAFDEEAPLSLVVAREQLLAFDAAEKHRIVSADYPDFAMEVVVNRNMLDFYATVPSSMIGENMYSRWAMYANAPTDQRVAEELYPQLDAMLDGMSELEAANRILNLVQTGFQYKRDDEVWDGDRVFFPDEALFYSVNDCDDRSVLFSRLMRDVLGLDAVLVFVPGHVLVGIEFKGDVKGAYVMVGGRKFVLCEPTCTNGAPVGWNNIKEGADLNVYLLDF